MNAVWMTTELLFPGAIQGQILQASGDNVFVNQSKHNFVLCGFLFKELNWNREQIVINVCPIYSR